MLYALEVGKVDMNEEMTPHRVKPEKILQTAIDENVPAIMSYLSRDKWHVAKVLLTDLVADNLKIECTSSKKRPINIQVNQPVGLSFKYGYGKFVFDTIVEGLEPSPSPQADRERGGTIVLAMPQKIEVVQRRSYFRVSVPESLKIEVLLWHRSGKLKEKRHLHDATDEMHNCCHGRLDDISAGGAQITVPHENGVLKVNLKKGQFIGVRFTPTPYETPVMFTAQIRNVLPTADGESSSLGLQIVGLEASPEGRQVLTRLIHVVEQYYQMNQSGIKQQDMQPIPSAV
jgi:hypothetical protein